jgi:hypothetical protein
MQPFVAPGWLTAINGLQAAQTLKKVVFTVEKNDSRLTN